MKVFIKVWPNKSASLVTESDGELWTFSSLEAAKLACGEWQNDLYIDYEHNADDVSCATCSVS